MLAAIEKKDLTGDDVFKKKKDLLGRFEDQSYYAQLLVDYPDKNQAILRSRIRFTVTR